jgi:hypothetical protein
MHGAMRLQQCRRSRLCVALVALLLAVAGGLWFEARVLRSVAGAHRAAPAGAAGAGRGAPAASGDADGAGQLPASWRVLFCPPLQPPWSFPYLEAAWERAAELLNVTAHAAEAAPAAPAASPPALPPPARAGLSDPSRGAPALAAAPAAAQPPPTVAAPAQPPPTVAAPAQRRLSSHGRAALTPQQQQAQRSFYSWFAGAMPWRAANAMYFRLYKCANDAWKGARSGEHRRRARSAGRVLTQRRGAANIMIWNNDSAPMVVDAAEVITQRTRNPQLRTFTFVREPLGRFISGCVRRHALNNNARFRLRGLPGARRH